MDIKKFLPIQSKNFDNSEEYFWSLLIEPGLVQAGAWYVSQDIVQIASVSPSVAWGLPEELVDASDSALSSVASELPLSVKDPVKTVFGVINGWLSDGVIKSEYLSKIKNLCSELGLKPIGFVVLPEAMALYLKYQEHSPASAIFIGCHQESIEISVFRLGNLLGATSVAKSVSFVEDVIEGLSRFSISEGIPSRVILYNGKESELERLRQDLLAVDWSLFKNLKFIHQPKIEIFSPDKKIRAISFAGGVEIAKAKGISLSEVANVNEKNVFEADQTSQHDKPELVSEDLKEELPPSYFGFSNKSLDEGSEEKNVELHKNVDFIDDEFDALGDLNKIKEEVYDNASVASAQIKTKDQENINRNVDQRLIKSMDTDKKKKLIDFKMPKFFFSLIPFLKNALLAIKTPIMVGFVVLITIFVSGFVAWWYYPTAEVVVYVSPMKLDEKIQITVNAKENRDNNNTEILPGRIIQTNVSGRKTKEASGTKVVGEKAKGEVTLYRVGPEIKLKSGTILTSTGGLKFTLDDEVVVASGSASSPSETKVAVTASQIGTDYNLTAGAVFSVSNYSINDIEGKNENAFSGGTSREVTSVTSNDHKELAKDLMDELLLVAKPELEKLLLADEVYVEKSLRSKANEKRFSHNVGAEAENVELFLDLTVSAVAISNSKILELAILTLESKIPQGFAIRNNQVNFSFELANVNDQSDIYVFDVFITANLLPQVETEVIAQKIKGKYPLAAEEILQNEVAGYVRAEIRAKPKLPGRLGTLPQVAKNIDVMVSAEK